MANTVRAHVTLTADKYVMFTIGEKLGLTGAALENFKWACCDVHLALSVERLTGVTTIIAVDGRKVEAL